MGKGQSYVVIGIVLAVILCLYTFTSGRRQDDVAIEGYQNKDEILPNSHNNNHVIINRTSPSAGHTVAKPKGQPFLHTVQNNENRTRLNSSILKKLRDHLNDRKAGRNNISSLFNNITNLRKPGFTEGRLSGGMSDGDSIRKSTSGIAVNEEGIKLRGSGVKGKKNDSVGGGLSSNSVPVRRLGVAGKGPRLPQVTPQMTNHIFGSNSLSNNSSLSDNYSDLESLSSSLGDEEEEDRNYQKSRSDNDRKKQREGTKFRAGMQTSWIVKMH